MKFYATVYKSIELGKNMFNTNNAQWQVLSKLLARQYFLNTNFLCKIGKFSETVFRKLSFVSLIKHKKKDVLSKSLPNEFTIKN